MPMININGTYIEEYRHLIELEIGRKLLSSEVVHHINFNHEDNMISNLKLMTRSEHTSMHRRLSSENKIVVGYSVDEDIKKKFDKYCKDNSINKSSLIEKFLADYIKKGEVK